MPDPPSSPLFPSTRWTLLQQVREGSEKEARDALEALCRAYWHPLYCVARRWQLSEPDAQDAVQGFFLNILRIETFATANESSGKLRQLLLKAFENFCQKQWRDANRQKRGGGAVHVEFSEFFDTAAAEERILLSNASLSIEALYNREWAHSLLERALNALRADYTRRGWQERYSLLIRPLLQQMEGDSLTALAASAGMTPGALRISLHRMRGHYREKIERELAITLDSEDPVLIRQEMTELFKALST